MAKTLKSANAAGWRAGMAPLPLINQSDGTKILGEFPKCPLNGFFQRFFWILGLHEGAMQASVIALKSIKKHQTSKGKL